MANPSLRGRQQLRVEVCAACGSTWFRKAEFSAYEPSQGSVLPPKHLRKLLAAGRLAPWNIAWQAVSRMPLLILVCLCGAPVRPVLSGGGSRAKAKPPRPVASRQRRYTNQRLKDRGSVRHPHSRSALIQQLFYLSGAGARRNEWDHCGTSHHYR